MSDNILYSFELFPPRNAQAEQSLRLDRQELVVKNPSFFSCTYSAGGSTRDRTLGMVLEINNEGHNVAPHNYFSSEDEEIVELLLNTFREAGINHLVDLRGDMPSGMGGCGMVYANKLVAYMRRKTGHHFLIDVTVYPEIHPQASSYESDLCYLKQKFELGANSAITQYFYNAEAYFYYMNRCQAAGITQPIVPGIMPITNRNNMLRFSAACGADIPRWIHKQMEAYGDDIESIEKFGTEVATNLCDQLLQGGAPGLHFYTMNRVQSTLTIWENLDPDNSR